MTNCELSATIACSHSSASVSSSPPIASLAPSMVHAEEFLVQNVAFNCYALWKAIVQVKAAKIDEILIRPSAHIFPPPETHRCHLRMHRLVRRVEKKRNEKGVFGKDSIRGITFYKISFDGLEKLHQSVQGNHHLNGHKGCITMYE